VTSEKALENYYFYTGKASDIIRQLALAAIAVVWVFKIDRAGQPTVPRALFIAAGWTILTLAIDALQYLYGAAAWGIFHRVKEKAGESNFAAPAAINWITILCFWSKAIAVAVTYTLILNYLICHVPATA